MFRVVVRARENGGFVYQIFTVGSAEPRPFQSDRKIYATREEAERAGYLAAAILVELPK
jgi:hypothetical protein